MLKLIKEAQVIAKLGDKVEFAKQLQEAFGKQAISEVADIVVENDFSMDMDAATLLDKVTAFAYDEGVPSHMLHDPKVFTRFANEVFIADEEEYGIVMSPSQRRKIAAQAYQLHTQRVSQENEERGAIINAQRVQQAAEERFRQERARRRDQADNEWATRHIQDPRRRAETINSMEDEESEFDDEYVDAYDRYVASRRAAGKPYVTRQQWAEDRYNGADYEDEEYTDDRISDIHSIVTGAKGHKGRNLGDKIMDLLVWGDGPKNATTIKRYLKSYGLSDNQINQVRDIANQAGKAALDFVARKYKVQDDWLADDMKGNFIVYMPYLNAGDHVIDEWRELTNKIMLPKLRAQLGNGAYEDEEQGWPSDERPTIYSHPSDEEVFDIDDDESDDYTDYSMRQGETGNPDRQERIQRPFDDHEDWDDTGPFPDRFQENEEMADESVVATVRDLVTQGVPVFSGIAGGMGKIVDIDARGVATIKLRGRRRLGAMNISNVPGGLEIIQHNGEYIVRNAGRDGVQENEERDPVAPHLQHLFRPAPRGEYNEYKGRGVHPKVAQELATDKEPAPELTPEQQGWYDAQFGKEAASQDPRYLQGYERWKKVGKPWEKGSQENEEDAGKPGSMLKSLLSQKKEVSAKANDALKKIESEGAKAFHEHRMKAEKAPYHEKKNADEHKAWMKGWMKAAQEHYHPEPVGQPKAKVKPKKK